MTSENTLKCSFCNKNIGDEDFYIFSCGHIFHKVKNYLPLFNNF